MVTSHHLCLPMKSFPLMFQLIENGTQVDDLDPHNRTPLAYAALSAQRVRHVAPCPKCWMSEAVD